MKHTADNRPMTDGKVTKQTKHTPDDKLIADGKVTKQMKQNLL